jgi:hypothetical protein
MENLSKNEIVSNMIENFKLVQTKIIIEPSGEFKYALIVDYRLFRILGIKTEHTINLKAKEFLTENEIELNGVFMKNFNTFGTDFYSEGTTFYVLKLDLPTTSNYRVFLGDFEIANLCNYINRNVDFGYKKIDGVRFVNIYSKGFENNFNFVVTNNNLDSSVAKYHGKLNEMNVYEVL